LNFVRAAGITEPVEIKIYKQSRGRRIVAQKVVARFGDRTEAVRWNGRANRPRKKVTNGYYFARFRVKGDDGAFTRRVALRRVKGRFRVVEPFYHRASCGLVRQFKLGRTAFGGRSRGALKISYLLGETADVTVVVLRGDRTIKTFASKAVNPGALRRLRLSSRGLKRGDYRVRLTAESADGDTQTVTLASRRL